MMLKFNKIVVIGSANTDMVIYTDGFPKPGETIVGDRFFMDQGGKGANQAVAASRLGGHVSFICKVGKDFLGSQTIQCLQNEGIDVSNVVIERDCSSGVAMIMVDKKGQNYIIVAPGANMTLEQKDIEKSIPQIQEAEILLMQLEIPLKTVMYAAKFGNALGKKVILDPAPAMVMPDILYSYVYMITPNETEAEFLTGIQVSDETSAHKAAALLKRKGVEVVVITMADKGAYLLSDGIEELIPSPNVKAIDTVAAGDTFNGALAVALVECSNLSDAVRFANEAASVAVRRRGAQSSIPFRSELESFKTRNLDPNY